MVEGDVLEVALYFVDVDVIGHDDGAVELVIDHLFILVVIEFPDLVPHTL